MKWLLLISLYITGLFSASTSYATAQRDTQYYDIVVAQDSSGDFTNLGAALASLPMFTYERTTIFVKQGVYHEKVRINNDYISIIGADKSTTVIEYSIPRPEWQENQDLTGPAVVNIHADDVILKNITVKNSQPDRSIHAFAVYGKGTRTVFLNCNFLSKGGDTVSLWNHKEGMYYHDKCRFEGAVDFVCPRGWCYISNSEFHTTRETAAIWHAGSHDQNQKFVIANCSFDGDTIFEMGRHHYEAQFYLLQCHFSDKLKDKPIYRVTYPNDPSRNRPYIYGERKYFYECSKDGLQYEWMNDNLFESGNRLSDITAQWTFDGSWNPEKNTALQIKAVAVGEDHILVTFDDIISIKGNLTLETASGITLTYLEGGGSKTIKFHNEASLPPEAYNELYMRSGYICGTTATATNRTLPYIPSK